MERGDIKLNGKEYRIDIPSYKFRDITDFSPRATTSGGSIIHSELDLYQPYLMTSWVHGFGFAWHTDAMGYLRTEGNIDTRQPGIVGLFTKEQESDTDDDVKEGFTTFNNAAWSWGPGGLRKYSGGSWADSGSYGTVNFAFAVGSYLFVCVDGARIQKVTTGDVHSDAGLNANSTDYHWLIIHSGYIYAGKDGTPYVHYDSNDDLSQLEGDSNDTGRITVGAGALATIGAITYMSNLYISRPDGLWQLGEDLIARKALNFEDETSADNFRSMAVHNDYLVFPIRDTIFQWNGARLSDITPPPITDVFPYTTYGRFDNFVVEGPWLFLTARTNETAYTESILCFDGKGWHRLVDVVTAGTDTITAMGLDVVNNYLWYHLDSSPDQTYYIPLQSESQLAATPYPFDGLHALITSRLDAGFRRVTKSMISLLVGGSNLSGTQFLKVFYQLDDATSWTQWDNVTKDGTTELVAPGGLRSQEFKYIKLKIEFHTGDGAQTPVLEELTLRFIMRPDTIYGYAFTLPIADKMVYGQHESMDTGRQMLDDLEAARDSKSPVEFIDLWERVHKVYVTSVNGRVVEKKEKESEDSPSLEAVIDINLVEVVHAEAQA